MSTKCTILSSKNYHFYFDYKDMDYHLEYDTEEEKIEFLRRIGKILECCPFSDSGIYMIELKKGTSKRVNHKFICELLEEKKRSKKCLKDLKTG